MVYTLLSVTHTLRHITSQLTQWFPNHSCQWLPSHFPGSAALHGALDGNDEERLANMSAGYVRVSGFKGLQIQSSKLTK